MSWIVRVMRKAMSTNNIEQVRVGCYSYVCVFRTRLFISLLQQTNHKLRIAIASYHYEIQNFTHNHHIHKSHCTLHASSQLHAFDIVRAFPGSTK